MQRRTKKGIAGIAVTIVVGIVVDVAGGILLPYTSRIAQAWDWIGTLVGNVFSWLTSDHQIAGWLFFLLLILSAITIVVCAGVAYLAITRNRDTLAVKLPFLDYTSDTIGNLEWRWRWNGGNVVGLWCYCPTCDGELIPLEHLGATEFVCENCTRDLDDHGYPMHARPPVATKQGSINQITDSVTREIYRRMRTGEAGGP